MIASSSVSNSMEHSVYVWEVDGKPLSIQVNLDVVERLQHDLFQSPCHGNDVTGILIGRVHEGFPSTVIVEGYELVSENSGSAVAQHLQLADMVGTWNARGREQRAVGLFRAQTRGWLALGEEDVEIAQSLFPQCDNIFLVVRSTPGVEPRAGFFFWEGNHIQTNQSYQEFVFDSEVLRRQSGQSWRANHKAHVHIVDAEAEVLSEVSHASSGRSIRASWLTIGATWCVALASTLTCVHAFGPNQKASDENVASAPASNAAKFKVDYHGRAIEVNLNHGLPSEIEREDQTLSDRQRQLLRYVAQDVPPQEIAAKLGITPEAVEVHKQVLSQKLKVSGEAGLVRYAIKAGLVEP